MDEQDLQKLSADELEALVRHHNRLYWDQNKPEISDYEYDRLVNRLKAVRPESAALQEMGPSAKSAVKAEPGGEIRHTQPMLSLDKCYSDEDLEKWSLDFSGDVVMSPKFDGIACAIHYNTAGELDLAATRGSGTVGENITANVREIADVPRKLPEFVKGKALEVRGEIFMKLSVFAGFKDQGFSNPRNLAAGAIKQKDSSKSKAYNLSFAAYDLVGTDHASEKEKLEFLKSVGFPPVERHVLDKSALRAGYQDMAARRGALDYEIDGVVFKANLVSEQKRLGSNSHHPRYAIAYKFQGESGTTVLREIEWSVARSGAITPVGMIDPVSLSGAMVSRASLHHPGFIRKLGVARNCEVVVVRRGGVIPNVEFVSKAGEGEFVIPTQCPSCGGSVRPDKDFLYCANPSKCRDAVIGQLGHFAANTNMLGFGESLLRNAYDKGILRRPADFYTMTEAQLLTLDRVGTKLAKKLIAEVDKARTLDLATFLRAFGLPELGKHVSAILMDRFETLERVYQLTASELAAVHTVGDVIAKSVIAGLAEYKDEIDAVRAHVTLSAPVATAATTPKSGVFSGQSFVFTGKLATMDRKGAELLVKQHGGTPLDSVTKALSVLVVGDLKTEEKSTKQKTAEKLIGQGAAIRVMTESEFLAMIPKS